MLINPPGESKTPILPLGLASIAAYLKSKNKNINISVIDAWAENLEFEKIKNKVSETRADIIGIYMLSPRYDDAKTTIEICRKVLPDSLIIAGGPHPSALPIETLQEIPQLDISAVGEGEITMYEIVKGNPLPDIKGIAYRAGREIKLNPPREFIKNLDELPLPARELFPLKNYRALPPYAKKNPSFSMITSRGCPFQCAFCSKDVFLDNFRARSPKKVVDEMEYLINKYGAKEIRFYDDDFTLDMKRAEEICDEILKRGIKVIWSCITRVNLINENLLKKMKQAGCWIIFYGVESGNQKILDAARKGITIDQTISAFKITGRIGIRTLAHFMVGFPGETKETVQNTIDLIKKIRPDFIGGGILIIYPGSHFFKSVRNGKYLGKLKTLNEKEVQSDIRITGTYIKGRYDIFEDNLTFEQLRKAVQRVNREFYLRPQYILQSLKSIRSFSDLNYHIIGGIEVIKAATG